MSIPRKFVNLDHRYDTQLPTATAVENRMQIFSPQAARPSSNNRQLQQYEDEKGMKHWGDGRGFNKEFFDPNLGMVWVRRVELTQAHKDLLETIFTNYQHDGTFFEGKRIQYQLSRYDLLKKLGKENTKQNYDWLNHMFEDLKDVELTVYLRDLAAKINPNVKNPKPRYKYYFEFGILDGYGKTRPDEKGDVGFFLSFSPDYADLIYCGISLFYSEKVKAIVKKSNGVVKAIIRFCLANQFVPKQPIEKVFSKVGITTDDLKPEPELTLEEKMIIRWERMQSRMMLAQFKPTPEIPKPRTYTPKQISTLKALFKPVINSQTGEHEDNEIVRELREKLCIHITWEGSKCFIAYQKSELDAQTPNAITFYNPIKPRIKQKIKRKELKPANDRASSDESTGKKLFELLKNSANK